MKSTAVQSLLMGLFATASAAQQEPADPPTTAIESVRPGLTILLARPIALAADDVRARLAGQLAVEFGAARPAADEAKTSWLHADDEQTLVGAFQGQGFRVHLVADRIELTPAACGHLAAEHVAVLERHRARIEIERVGAFDPARRGDDYRLLAVIAHALLDTRALGISARAYGTFELVDEDTRDALLATPALDLLRPTAESSLVVLLSQPRRLTEASLQRAVAKELPRQFAEQGPGWVIARDGISMVGFDGHVVMISINPAADIDPETIRELRARKAVAGHRALLHLWTSGPVEKQAERRRQRTLARVAAALWQDDCLAINWYNDRSIIAAHQDLLQHLRHEDPVGTTLAQLATPVVTAEDEQAMHAAIETARRTWPRATARLRAGGDVSAKFPFPTRAGTQEHIWVSVTKVVGDKVYGTIANEPVDIEGLQLGSKVTRSTAELSDWLYFADGEMVGGYTVKVLREQARRQGKK